MSRHASLALVLFAAVSLFAQDSNATSAHATAPNATAPTPKVAFKTMIPVVYNTEAEKKQLHGRVDLTILFNEKGRVDKVDVLGGDPLLAKNAASFVKLWEIFPYVVDGLARPVKLNYSLQFVIKSVADEVPETDTEAPAHLVLSENISRTLPFRKKVQPVYPPNAITARVTGSVAMAAAINPDGHITMLPPLSGNPLLVPSAVDAVKQRQYEPLLLHGMPISFNIKITVDYDLIN